MIADVTLAVQNIYAQKTRSFLTALGIVFGVGSVIGMLAIGAGAKEESLRFIEQLGVRNVLIDSRAATSEEELQQRRRASAGLTERDMRVLEANIPALETLSPRRTLHPARVLPKPTRDLPELYGVRPSYAAIHNLRLVEGRFFENANNDASASVCVLGQTAKTNLLGYGSGKSSGGKMEDLNNIVYVPFNTLQYRFWDMSSFLKDELDGIDMRLKPNANSIEVAKVVTAILNASHNDTQDFIVTIPAALLAQQQRTQTIFPY